MLMCSIVSLVSSSPILGFYFVVKAAMSYLHTNGQLEGNVIEVAKSNGVSVLQLFRTVLLLMPFPSLWLVPKWVVILSRL